MKNSALILSVGGTLSALVGSLGVSYAAWAARLMLSCNLFVILLYVASALRRQRKDG